MKITEIVKEKLKEIEEIKERLNKFTYGRQNNDRNKWYRFINERKGTLKGMQLAIKSELEFLENEKFHLKENKNVHPLKNRKEINVTIRNMEDRITDCKNALKLIEEGK